MDNAKDDEAIEEARTMFEHLVLARDKIHKRLLEAVDNPHHFEKVQWFAACWNRSVGKMNSEFIVKGPGTLAEPKQQGTAPLFPVILSQWCLLENSQRSYSNLPTLMQLLVYPPA
jgi:hypothetical protein